MAKSTPDNVLVNSDVLVKELIRDVFNKAVDGSGSTSSTMNASNFNEVNDDVVKDDEARYVFELDLQNQHFFGNEFWVVRNLLCFLRLGP